jgi:flavodoxin
MEALDTPIQIIYTTTTGNSQTLAEETAEKLEETGLAE